MADLPALWSLLEEAWSASRQAPLSVRKAMLVVALADSVVDRLFERSEVTDILEFRRSLGTTFPALGLVMNIAAHGPGAPQVMVANCPVPIESYGELAVEDFMISLYNDHGVQRLVVCIPGAAELPALAALSEAVEALRGLWHAPVTPSAS